VGLSPAAGGGYEPRLPRFPQSLPKPAGRTAGTRPDDDQPAPGRSTAPHSGNCGLNSFPPRELEECVGSQALVQLPPKQPQQGTLEPDRSVQQGEKPVVILETTPSQKRAELNSIPKPEINQAAKVGIIRILIFYLLLGMVVHACSPSEEFGVGSITSIFSNCAVVKYSCLEDVLHGCSWKINNKLDGMYLPLPVDKIMQRTKQMVNKIVQYSLIEGNCEDFVNDLRYGVPRKHALTEGAKAAGAVISAVVDSIRPKPLTA
uniref:Phospholipase A and acyltransferase 5 n=1 Tax=Propithecus coquereli TaxID=379532 RepID=A0A2K6EWW3_PROCO